MFRFKLQLKFLIKKSKKLITDVGMFFSSSKSNFSNKLRGKEERKERRERRGKKRDWLEG